MTDTVIRSARLVDADRVFELLLQFATSYHPERNVFDRQYPALLASPGADLVVADQNARVVGYALSFRLLTLYTNGVLVELQELMVDPICRSAGIGRQLVETVIRRARESGAVELTVPTRRARDYYPRFGFEETATYFKLRL